MIVVKIGKRDIDWLWGKWWLFM